MLLYRLKINEKEKMMDEKNIWERWFEVTGEGTLDHSIERNRIGFETEALDI
jgi:hypothetical protein